LARSHSTTELFPLATNPQRTTAFSGQARLRPASIILLAMIFSLENSRLVRRLLMLASVWIVACVAVAASEFWESKPFTEWCEKEAEKILPDSPWAVLMAVPLPNRGPVPTGDSGGEGRGGGGGRGGGAEGFGPGPQRVRLTISWRSALPVKE